MGRESGGVTMVRGMCREKKDIGRGEGGGCGGRERRRRRV